MPRVPRTQLAPDGNSVTLHCYNRCVRRAGLCGYDPQTGIDYGYRKDWIQERLRELAGIFAIDLLSFAIMDNHFHLTCRTRPDISDNWTDDEVALRWYKLFPKRRTPDGQPAEPTEKELEDCLADSRNFSQEEWPKELRRRLQNISWLMKSICEPIAKRANKEDGVTGAFFQARFHCKKLLDESAILACSVYVELNPVRAVQAESPEQSKHTSVYERIVEHKFSQTKAAQKSQPKRFPTLRTSTGAKFLAPVRMEDRTSTEQSPEVTSRVRASDKGFLRLSLEKYLELIDWSGRQFHKEKPGAIPSHLAPILERLELNVETWLHSLQNFGKSLGWAIGKRTSMLKEQRRMGRTRMRGRPIAAELLG